MSEGGRMEREGIIGNGRHGRERRGFEGRLMGVRLGRKKWEGRGVRGRGRGEGRRGGIDEGGRVRGEDGRKGGR